MYCEIMNGKIHYNPFVCGEDVSKRRVRFPLTLFGPLGNRSFFLPLLSDIRCRLNMHIKLSTTFEKEIQPFFMHFKLKRLGYFVSYAMCFFLVKVH